MTARTVAATVLLLFSVGLGVVGDDPSLENAERLYMEGSYALARDVYLELDRQDFGPEQNRWVDFRLADTLWRSAAATSTPDPTDAEQARQALAELAAAIERETERDQVWAEVQESLGDFWWMRREARNWGAAWPHYEQALGFWAQSSDIDLARERYLKLVWKAAEPPAVEPFYYYGYHGNQLPEPVLRNVLRISDDPAHRARAQFLIAMTLRMQGGTPGQSRRVAEAFEAALENGRGSGWYDDALYHYAEWLTQSGRVVALEGGGFAQQPDFVRALEVFERLTTEFRKGETRYFDDARRQIDQISAPQVGVAVPQFFLPGTRIAYQVTWRNVSEVALALYPVDLARDLRWRQDVGSGEWLDHLERGSAAPARRWTWSTNDGGQHMPGQETLELEGDLAPGAYLLLAEAGKASARELVLVSQAAVVLKTSNREALIYVCDAVTGAPRADADVKLWIRSHDGRASWSESAARTDADGLVRIDLPDVERHVELFVAARDDAHQAIASSSRWIDRSVGQNWRIYVFTDRPAYRPADTARWKVVARQSDGSVYSTPAGRTLGYEISDPRGGKLAEGRLELNGFGSATGSTELGAEQPLGEYRITFHDVGGEQSIGGATLFRLEEYKLPEFRVEVRTPEKDGVPVALRGGDRVEAEVRAEYYFGGPVAGAEVEVLVHQRPLWIHWMPERELPWLYEELAASRPYWGDWPGQIVHQEVLATDGEGRAGLTFEPPFDPSQDLEYTIEARVTDASRRQITGNGTVRVSRQRYFVFLNAEHNLHRPGDEVRVEIRTRDANERPLAAEGTVRVTRDRWVEVWLDPAGREVSGVQLERVRRRERVFPPPPPQPGDPGWQLKFRGYEHDEILSRRMTTDEAGAAEVRFTPDDDGFYRVSWSGDEEEPFPVLGETTVWVADPNTVEIGYHPGGVQVLVDTDTFHVGRTTPVMISAPAADSWVLFSIESEVLHEWRVVHLTGTVKLIEIEVGQEHVPNVFLDAAMVRDGELFLDSRQVAVPPLEHFLELEVEADREEYRPRDTGTLTVTARDHRGQPVVAEVALALVDESVSYIQQDYAVDPRQFFYGDKRGKSVITLSSFHIRGYRDVLQRLGQDEIAEFDRDGGSFAEMGAVVAAAPAPAPQLEMAARGDVAMKSAVAQEARPAEPAVVVRSDFRATALWAPEVVTGADGTATVEVSLPDSLTTWKATARAATVGNQFGQAGSSVITRKPLIVRLQAPRFFVSGDRAVVSAIVNNNTEQDLDAEVSLQVEGDALEAGADLVGRVQVAPGGERRMDWPVEARAAGEVRLTVVARAGGHDDAMALDYPVVEHGIEKLGARSGKLRADEVEITLDLPRARREGSDSLVVQVTPSLAVTMLDALPYLIDYPYGCTEQTMSRFLPAVIVAGTLERLGLRREQVAGRMFGGIEAEHAQATHPRGAEDLARLDEMVRDGLNRLYDFQHGDGGWGWWKAGESDPFMTAYIVWGLGLAREADIPVDGGALHRGVEYLAREIVGAEQQPDLQAWMLHALAAHGSGRPTQSAGAALDNLWQQRDELNAYSRALLALSAHGLGDHERAQTLVRNLANGVKVDRAPDKSVVMRGASSSSGAGVMATAHWGADGIWWRWSEGPVESTAFALRALLAIDPQNDLVEPVTNWLIRNRRGAQWSNTRDTAISVLALTDYLRASGELEAAVAFEVWINGRKAGTERVEAADALGAPSRFAIDPAWLRDGANAVRIVRTDGDGPLYFAADARYFSLEEPIPPAGHEIFVRREYDRLAGRPTLLAGRVYDRLPLDDRGSISSGERVEVSVIVEAKNDYEYLVFEDLKPAGLEAVQVRSGELLYARELTRAALERLADERDPADYTGRSRLVHQELRDRKVALFVDKLPQGTWEIRYELRAETPGEFHALPLVGYAMYVPEIRANGAELRLTVEEAARDITTP